MSYTVKVADNFHYMDESQTYELGEFADLQDAVSACKRMVDDWLAATYEDGTTAESLYQHYKQFGKDPYIVGESFSAWSYAKQRCEALCMIGHTPPSEPCSSGEAMSSASANPVDDMPQRRSVDWPPFAEKLAGVLGALEEDQFLVVSVKRSNRFVQFAAQGAFGMRVETTSNQYLTASERLGPGQFAALEAAGWRGPTGNAGESTPEKDPDGSPNFFVEYDAPVPFNAVAELAVHTLTEILRVPHPGFLEYEAFDASGNAILLPSLGLMRATRPAQPAPSGIWWNDRIR